MNGLVEVFATEPTRAQLIWRRRGAGRSVVRVGAQMLSPGSSDAILAWELHDLTPGSTVPILVNDEPACSFTTMPSLGDARPDRIATISDIHLGEPGFGFLPRRRRPDGDHALICLRAALTEIVAWQADVLVVKGDIAHEPDRATYDLFADEIAATGLRVIILPGNHDGGNHRGVSMVDSLAAVGHVLTDEITVVDLAHVRVIAASSLRSGNGLGRIRAADAVFAAASRAPSSVLLATHHQCNALPVPTYWPIGIPYHEAKRFLDALAEASPRTLMTSGHTHRHRARRHGPLMITEVGSTKDYPGAWGGYLAGPDAIVQVVRRVADPEALRWTESTRSSVANVWGKWSAGRLDHRSFHHPWPS
jgi:3',5'-cyclic-AMP phosphodiesterase